MNFVHENDKKYVLISDQADLDELVGEFTDREDFAQLFKFSDRKHFFELLDTLNVKYGNSKSRVRFFDPSRKLHITESDFGYIWISTIGLVAKDRMTKNRAVNACLSQRVVVRLLLENAIEVISDESVYDIDSHNFELLSELSPAIFHNLTFYVEVFCKAYMSVTGTNPPHSHKLQLIYQKTIEVMNSNKHNNSLFQVMILDPLKKLVDHLDQIPGNFKEQFIKYDDNPLDETTILFEAGSLNEMLHVVELADDFIVDYYYTGSKNHYLRTGLYQRLLDKADSEEQVAHIKKMYPDLAISD